MMISPYDAHRHPTVAMALQKAGEIVHAWVDCEAHASIRAAMTGWPAVELVDLIACALLEEGGFDIEGLTEALVMATTESEIGDILGSWPERGAPEGFWDDE